MSPTSRGSEVITDPATQIALERLAESRLRLAGWTAQMAERNRETSVGFQPRSETLRMLMGLGLPRLMGAALPRLPWIKWGFSAFMLWRSWRRRST